jgi:hypothetical protein
MKVRKVIPTHYRYQYGYYQWMDHFFGRSRVFKWHKKSRTKLFQKLHQRMKDQQPGTIFELERRKDLSAKEFKREYIWKGKPVILEGAAKDWACTKNWSLEYFKDLYGEEEILHVDHKAIEAEYERMTLGEILDDIRGGGARYYRFYPLLQRHPEHLKDFDYEFIFKSRHKWSPVENFQVFIGGEGSYTPLHNAYGDNIFTQAYGEKEWMIYPSIYSMIMDPDPAQNVYRNASYRYGGGIFNPFEPNFETHPLFQYIDGYHLVLKPGDVLYNPPYWWHAVKNPTDSIGVGYRWMNPWHQYKEYPLYFFLDLCAKNPSFRKSLQLAKTDINLLHLAQTGRLDDFLEKEKTKKESNYKTV